MKHTLIFFHGRPCALSVTVFYGDVLANQAAGGKMVLGNMDTEMAVSRSGWNLARL